MTTKEQEVYQAAEQLYRRNPDWVSFFRETLGVGGIVRTAYPEPEALAAFEQTHEYTAIQHMVANLRERSGTLPPPQEATRVITIRLPQSLHESLRAEAHDMHTSMNKLCISKLLQLVDNELVPTDSGPAKTVRGAETVEAE
jgi:predicted HicB family RNase H-like nuclease